jgi:hypothetical protein
MHAVGSGRTATAVELVRLGADIHAKKSVRFRCSRVQPAHPVCRRGAA